MNDPKFVWVAHKAETNVATVIAVWAALLEHASQERERGSVEGFDCESYDCSLGLPDGTCKRVMDAMRGKGLLEVSRVAMWEARQPKTEDNSTDRVRAFRERKKAECNADETACNGNETPRNTDKIRLEKKKKEEGAGAPPFDPSGISGLNLKAWALWVDHRKAIKKPLKPHSLPLAAKQLAALGASQLAEVERAVAGGWQGLHPAASVKPKADPYANAI